MKKILFAFSLFALCSFRTQSEKTFEIKMTEAEVTNVWNTLEGVQKYMAKSNLPHQDVITIVASIDSVKTLIAKQVRAQSQPPAKK